MKKFLITGICSLMFLPLAAVSQLGGYRGVKAGQESADIPYKTLIYEDFSLFTGGSEQSPVSATVNDNLQVIPDSKTLSPGWQGVEIHEAGGMAYQGAGGVLFTPDIDLSGNGGEFRVSFRMKLAPGSKSGVAYAQHQRISSQYTVRLTEQWQTVTYTFSGGLKDDYVAIRAVDASNPSGSTVKAFIDDIRIEVPDPAVEAPSGVAYDNFDGTSFDVYWKPVAQAERYELSLYTEDDRGTRHPVGGDFSTTETQYRFEGLKEDWSGYRVSVRAIKGSDVSPYSAPLAVEGLPAPMACKATFVDDTEFNAAWDAVDNAYSYEVRTYYEHTPADDERFYLTDTQFDFVKAADQPSEIDVAFAQMPGWFFGAAEFQDGYIGIQGAFALLGYAAQIESPQLDLTASGGKVSVSFRVRNDDTRTGVIVSLFVRDRGDYRVADDMQVTDITKNWRTVTTSLSGGTDRCILAIIPTGSGNLYVDDLKVYQNVKEGMTVSRLADYGVTSSPATTVKGLSCPAGDRLCYTVRTVGVNAAGTRYIYSPESSRVYVYNPAGVDDAGSSTSATVTVAGGTIHVENPANEPVVIFNAAGQAVSSSRSATCDYTPAVHGLYIVKTGGSVTKVSL